MRLKGEVCRVRAVIRKFDWSYPSRTSSSFNVSGSGFCMAVPNFTNSKYIWTAYHVVDEAEKIYIDRFSGDPTRTTNIEATIIVCNPDLDIALLKLTKDISLTSLQFSDSNSIKLGDVIHVIGYALGSSHLQSTKGVVSGRTHIIQIDAGVNSGNSGGPICDDQGKVLGIVVSTTMLSLIHI